MQTADHWQWKTEYNQIQYQISDVQRDEQRRSVDSGISMISPILRDIGRCLEHFRLACKLEQSSAMPGVCLTKVEAIVQAMLTANTTFAHLLNVRVVKMRL